jgi:hypothetical protein
VKRVWVGIVTLWICVSLLGTFVWVRFAIDTPQGEAVSPSGRLVCSERAYKRDMRLLAKAGEMYLGFNSNLETAADVDRLLASFDALALTGSQTVVVAMHIATGQAYQQTCAAERCTMAEMAQPNFQCQTDHFNGCTEVALRFRSQDYCIIAPVQVAH